MKEREEVLIVSGYDGKTMEVAAFRMPLPPTAEDYAAEAEEFDRRAKRLGEAVEALQGLANHLRRLAEKCGGAGD